ncbi:hypothetical protein AAVH_03842 [Aphelenchoides avenae]|nr:hypothetical protein AAVH_03842 [Aphelenchus avenae]
MPKRPRLDDTIDGPHTSTSQPATTSIRDIISTLRGLQGTAAKLRRKLHCGEKHPSNISADSKTDTWLSYAERLRSDLPDNGCRLLTEEMYSVVDGLLTALGDNKDKKVRARIITNDVLIDVFMDLARVDLDALQLTCVRFKAIVDDHLEKYCFRTLTMEIANLTHADKFHIYWPGQPAIDSEPGVYRLRIAAEMDECTSPPDVDFYRVFFFEANTVHEILAKCEEKILTTTYMRFIRLTDVPDAFQQLVGSHPALASRMIVGQAWIQAHFHQDYDVDALKVLDRLSAFQRVNELGFFDIMLLNVNDEFFRRCRAAGILALSMVLFGPTRDGLDSVTRYIEAISFFDTQLFRRALEAVKSRDKPRHRIRLCMRYGDLEEELGDLEEEVAKHYDSEEHKDKHSKEYVKRLDDKGVEIRWHFSTLLDQISLDIHAL